AGLEEERRLAHVGLTRARRRAKIFFATNRRIRGTWSSTAPSRFLDELPEAHVEVTESKSGFAGMGYGSYGPSRFDDATALGSNHTPPGWQRAQSGRRGRYDDAFDDDPDNTAPSNERGRAGGGAARHNGRAGGMRAPVTIEGELVARSTGTVSPFARGD